MIVVTTPTVSGTEISEVLGLVRGSSIRSKHAGKDIIAAMRNFAGGEIYEYTKMLAQAREQAVDRMIEEAQILDADAIVAVRFQTSMVMRGAAEMLCYGTAIRLVQPATTPGP
ncbi:MAG: YbjQ family protein [Longimicrobiales bacterium]|nr:YbjQ family protein [Longimicrobiales bacterium]